MLNFFIKADSRFNLFIEKARNILWINILTVIFCIPIITIGASLTAMNKILIDIVNEQEGYITKTFFKTFKSNFIQATKVWLIALVCLYVGFVDMSIMNKIGLPSIFKFSIWLLTIFVGIGVVYVFPVIARYENSTKNTIKNTYIYAIANFPQTICIVVCSIIPIYVAYKLQVLSIFLITFGVSFIGYLNARIIMKVFRKYENAV